MIEQTKQEGNTAPLLPKPAAYDLAGGNLVSKVDAVKPSTTISGGGNGGGLSCSLGPAYMPTSCALYPLGDLWSTPVAEPSALSHDDAAAQSPADEASVQSTETSTSSSVTFPPLPERGRAHFYSLDQRRCEGVVEGPLPAVTSAGASSQHAASGAASSAPVPTHTVASYRKRNDLHLRRAGGDWFASLATAIAVLGPDQAAAAAIERLEAAAIEAAAEADAASADAVVTPQRPQILSDLLSRARQMEEKATAKALEEANVGVRGRGRRKSASPSSAAASGPSEPADLSHTIAAAVQSRLRGILYHQSGLLLPDPAPHATSSSGTTTTGSTMLPPSQLSSWQAQQRRIEATAVAYVVRVLDAAAEWQQQAERLERWTLQHRLAVRSARQLQQQQNDGNGGGDDTGLASSRSSSTWSRPKRQASRSAALAGRSAAAADIGGRARLEAMAAAFGDVVISSSGHGQLELLTKLNN